MALDPPSLKGRALRLLSGREHSRPELERKLQRFEEEPGSLALALDELAAKGFISEAASATAKRRSPSASRQRPPMKAWVRTKSGRLIVRPP